MFLLALYNSQLVSVFSEYYCACNVFVCCIPGGTVIQSERRKTLDIILSTLSLGILKDIRNPYVTTESGPVWRPEDGPHPSLPFLFVLQPNKYHPVPYFHNSFDFKMDLLVLLVCAEGGRRVSAFLPFFF